MIVLAIRHEVRDYDQWKSVFDTYPPTAAGARFHRVNRRTNDPNFVTVVSGWSSQDAAEAFTKNPDLKAKMGDAGVVGAPAFEFYEEVEAVTA